jgi:magnesium transporter
VDDSGGTRPHPRPRPRFRTLNVLYVIDDRSALIDDLRARDVLLAPATTRVADMMNLRFAALRVTDDQRVAIELFRREDRTALPASATS